MSGLRIGDAAFESLRSKLLDAGGLESCAIGFASHDAVAGRWIVSEAEVVPDEAYAHRDEISVSLKTEAIVDMVNRARLRRLSPVLIHSHPGAAGSPIFSAVDDAGEAELAPYLRRRIPDARPLALVVGPHGCSAREVGKEAYIPVWQIGQKIRLLSGQGPDGSPHHRYDRQIRAFGREGQRIVSSLRILVIGAGGTGSATLQQLAHLGASDIAIVDPDRVEESNLNRLVGAGPSDVGAWKVDVARRTALHVNPAAKIEAVVGDIVDDDVARIISRSDFVFICTDSHASRAVAGQAAYQFLVPAIDMGVSITVADDAVTHVTGRVQMLAPGLPCLTCTKALDGSEIRREMLTPEQRSADPYVQGGREPQPAVVSLNSTMASLAVTMFLGAVTGVPAAARFQIYDGIRGTVRPTTAAIQPSCIVCSGEGALAQGHVWPLPVRHRTVGHV